MDIGRDNMEKLIRRLSDADAEYGAALIALGSAGVGYSLGCEEVGDGSIKLACSLLNHCSLVFADVAAELLKSLKASEVPTVN